MSKRDRVESTKNSINVSGAVFNKVGSSNFQFLGEKYTFCVKFVTAISLATVDGFTEKFRTRRMRFLIDVG